MRLIPITNILLFALLCFACHCFPCLCLLCYALCCPNFPFLSFHPFPLPTTLHYIALRSTPLRPSPQSKSECSRNAGTCYHSPCALVSSACLPTYPATDALRLHGIVCAMHRPPSMKALTLIKMLMALPRHRWVAAKTRYEYDHLAQRRPSPSEH